METLCLIKATVIPLVILVALIWPYAASTPLPSHEGARSLSKSAAMEKCLERLRSKEEHPAADAASKTSGTATSLTTDSDECKNILDNLHTGSSVEGDQKMLSSSASASSSTPSGSLPTEDGRRIVNTGPNQPLSRRSRDIGAADKEMILRAQYDIVSHMMDTMEAGDSTAQGMSGGARPVDSFTLTLNRLHALNQLKKAVLQGTDQVDNAELIQLIPENPSVALGHVASSGLREKEDEEREDLEDALASQANIDEEDSPFSHSPAAVQSPNFSTTKNNNQQTRWAGPDEAASESDVMSGPMGKRSDYSGRYSRARLVQKRNRNTLSVNNAMMAITNMLLAEQKERLQRNRQRIRQHMLIQG